MIDEQNIIQKLQHGLDEYLLKNPNEEDSEVVSIISEIINTLKIKAEPKVNCSKVPIDTPILVSNDGLNWHNRHFAKFRFDSVFAWDDGATSWTTCKVTKWKYVRLKENKRGKKNDQ